MLKKKLYEKILNERFILEDEGKIKIYCAYHNEFINTDVQIFLLLFCIKLNITKRKTIRRIIYMKDMIENLNATTIFIILFFLLVFFLGIHVFLIYFRHTNWKKRA